jgi:hypothetical protein
MKRWIISVFGVLLLVVGVQAQTASDPNEGLNIALDSTSGAFNLSWWGRAGRTYFIQHSDDLLTWSYFPVIESGGDSIISWGFSSAANQFFLRLKGSDLPTSDPANTDFAGDGMTAMWKLLVGFDPLVWVDPLGDANGDGINNYTEFLNNTNALKPAPVLTLTAPSGAVLVP